MRKNGSGRAALAATGAAAGTAFASGRALAGFYAQLGGLSWLAVGLSAAVFGMLTGLCAKHAARFGAGSFAELCRRGLSRGACRAEGLLHGLLMALTAHTMLFWCARLGELSLPLHGSALCGMGLALALAALLGLRGGRPMPWMGLLLLAAGAAFYGGLALDPRPPRLGFRGQVVLTLGGSLPAAVLLPLCHGALNACAAANAAARFSRGASPGKVGCICGGGMWLVLALGNAALRRGGEALLARALPVVLLAARWGIAGFWLCCGFGFLCAAATLAACLSSLAAWVRKRC